MSVQIILDERRGTGAQIGVRLSPPVVGYISALQRSLADTEIDFSRSPVLFLLNNFYLQNHRNF